MSGKILNIQKFCIDDGPGIRTTIFMKGCPLTCLWCHNPESQLIKNELMYDRKKCVNCLRCVLTCPRECHHSVNGKHEFNLSNCISCGECVNNHCEALELIGYEISAVAAMQEVLKDKIFYEHSGGGVTLSGGEPLYQAAFCLELLRKAKENELHICMETCGFAPSELLKKTAEFVDIYLFDYKETNPEKHRAFTGMDNQLILENLKMLDQMGKVIILRCPIIPGYNDTDEHFNGIAKLANNLAHIIKIELEPYHEFGAGKYEKLGRTYNLPETQSPSASKICQWIDQIQKGTKVAVVKA